MFTPDTSCYWQRKLVATKSETSEKWKSGRPRVRYVVVDLAVQFGQENRRGDCDRIQGTLANVEYRITDTTVSNTFIRNGIEPVPDRRAGTTWSTFVKAHQDVLAASDFTTLEVWTKGGLVTFYLLFVVELKTRRVDFLGATANSGDSWMKQAAREFTVFDEGFLNDNRFLIMDRDGVCFRSYGKMLANSGIQPICLPAKSSNLNTYIEHFVRSLKSDIAQHGSRVLGALSRRTQSSKSEQ